MKKVLIVFLSIILLVFSIVPSTFAEDETKRLTTINNPNGVLRYGNNGYVEIVKEYKTAYSEMRGVWVATVYNIAISKQEGFTEQDILKYKKEFLGILDRMSEYGMNTLFFQVRPSNDAFYDSKLNPWSKFLISEGTNPGWDPLEWMIEETHNRGFTFMCWMNAFRVTTETYIIPKNGKNNANMFTPQELVEMKLSTLNNLSDDNFAKKHPEYVVAGLYDEKLILNPSEPAVQKFIVDTIMEIVENYDVDGLHFDDYFYLDSSTSSDTSNNNFGGGNTYRDGGEQILNDLPNYDKYLEDPKNYGKEVFESTGIYGMEAGLNLGDFRRENINIMMRNIRYAIDKYNTENNKCVEFGTKPAAVWRSNSEYCTINSTRCHVNGSNTAEGAYSTYSDLYADSLKWVEEGLVDWVAPQVYYSFEDKYAPYADVVDWWAEQVERINNKRKNEGQRDIRLYIAHGIYKYRDNPDQFYSPSEMLNQLKFNNKYDIIKGSAVYSYEILYKPLNSSITVNYPNAEGNRIVAMRLFKETWSKQVYPLEVGEDDSTSLKLENYYIKESTSGNVILKFNTLENARAYGIYKVPKYENFNKQNIEYRQDVIYAGYEEEKQITIDFGNKDAIDENYLYYIVPVSKNGYVSNNYTIINLEDRVINQAPNSTNINISNYQTQFKAGSTITASFEIPQDPNGDNITYKIALLEDGVIRNISPIVVENNNKVSISWTSFFIDSYNCQFKVVFSDGELITEAYSNMFDLVEYFKPENVNITVDKDEYNIGDNLIVNYTNIIDRDSMYIDVRANIVIDNIRYDITNEYLQSIDNSFKVIIPRVSSDDCYIEFILNDGINTVVSTSSKFVIKKQNMPPKGGQITINKTEYELGEILQGNIVLPIDEDNDNISYNLYFVSNSGKETITLTSDLSFEVFLPNIEMEDCYIKMIVTDGINETTIESERFLITKVEDVPTQRGCGKCNNNNLMIYLLSINIIALMILLRKKNK